MEEYKKYMDINFEYYRIFYYVAKYRNITKAAAALGSSQPNVTRVMKLLESQMNCRLFTRGAKGICLTEEGEILYNHVEIACRQLWDAQEEIGRQNIQNSGTVKIGATETALHLFLLMAIQDFKQEYPGIRIKIHNHTTPEILKYLMGGGLDFAVVTTPFKVPGTFSRVKILAFQEILAGGVQYESLGKKALEPADVGKYPWVGIGRGSATYELYKDFFIKNGIDMEPDIEVATSDLMLPLIENNMGIGFVPEKMAMSLLEEKRLVRISVKCKLPERSIQIVSDKERGKSLAADTFYKYLKKRRC